MTEHTLWQLTCLPWPSQEYAMAGLILGENGDCYNEKPQKCGLEMRYNYLRSRTKILFLFISARPRNLLHSSSKVTLRPPLASALHHLAYFTLSIQLNTQNAPRSLP
jgi:hypothetical protein